MHTKLWMVELLRQLPCHTPKLDCGVLCIHELLRIILEGAVDETGEVVDGLFQPVGDSGDDRLSPVPVIHDHAL